MLIPNPQSRLFDIDNHAEEDRRLETLFEACKRTRLPMSYIKSQLGREKHYMIIDGVTWYRRSSVDSLLSRIEYEINDGKYNSIPIETPE